MNPIEIFSSSTRKNVLDQNRFRTNWDEHDSQENLEALYWEEHAEYEEAKQLCELGADPEKFASEAGDKGYLYIKLFEVTGGRVPRKIQYDILATYHDCQQLGIDFNQAVFYKICRNDVKYPLMFSRNGYGYEGSKKLSKDQYTHLGGDPIFLYAYMMIADELHSTDD